MADKLDEFVLTANIAGPYSLVAQKVLYELRDDVHFQKDARLVTILMRVAETMEEGEDTPAIFFRSVDDIVYFFEKSSCLGAIREKGKDNFISPLQALKLSLGPFFLKFAEDNKLLLDSEISVWFPAEPYSKDKVISYGRIIRKCGIYSGEAMQFLSQNSEDKSFVAWARAQRLYDQFSGEKHFKEKYQIGDITDKELFDEDTAILRAKIIRLH